MRNIFAVAMLGLAACSGTTGTGSSTGPGASSTGGGTGTGGSSGTSGGSTTGGSNCGGNGNACSSLVDGASVTYVVQIASVAPTPAGGGAPMDGTYYLTSASVYTGEGGAKGKTTESRQETLQISGSGTELNLVSNNDSCLSTAAGSLSFGATQVTLTATCPSGEGEGGAIGYTSNSGVLTLFITDDTPGGQGIEVQVFTLQPS
jgi:hypothetical protein